MPGTKPTTTPAAGAARREWYRRTYLNSTHWRTERLRAIERAGHRCERCRATPDLFHVHHLSYERLWRELPGDLQVLCEPCRDRLHGGKRRSARRRQPGRLARDRKGVLVVIDRTPRATGDLAALAGITEQRAGRALRDLRRQGAVKYSESRGAWWLPPPAEGGGPTPRSLLRTTSSGTGGSGESELV